MTTDNAQRFIFSLIGIATIAAIEIGLTPSVQAALLADWRFDPVTNQLYVTLRDGTTPRYFLLAQPPRIVLDLPNTQLGNVATKKNYSGPVREVRVAQYQEDVTRIVLELGQEVVLAPGREVQLQRAALPGKAKVGERWVLRPGIAGSNTPVETSNLRSLPTTLPPATGRTQQPAVVSVPPLNRAASNPVAPQDGTLPPATFGTQPGAVVSVPPLRSPNSSVGASTTATTRERPTGRLFEPYRQQVIEFGQPLPTTPSPVLPLDDTSAARTPNRSLSGPGDSMPTTSQSSSRSPDTLLPAGTQLILRYAGKSALSLKAGLPQEEVLLLAVDVRDRQGNLIAPAGTPVIGRFETDTSGSRFIARAIALQDRNLALAAQSDILDSDLQLSENRIVGNSALGAAATDLIAPEPITLQPGQILQIRLIKALGN